jgi:hypothetical protein
MRLSDRDRVRASMTQEGASPADEEIEQLQAETLAQLRNGELVVKSTSDREVALMFSNLDAIAPTLVEDFDWRFLVIPSSVGEVVLPDVGVTMYDPTPKFPTAGTGLKSSPRSETVLHLDPHLVLMLRPGRGYGQICEATPAQVENLNMRAIACSDSCVYGRSADVVESVVRRARSDPDRIARLRPRAATIWIAEGEGAPQAGRMEFVGRSLDGTMTQALYVSPEGVDEARERAIRLPERDETVT